MFCGPILTHRFIGGLNSAHDLTGEAIFLEKSLELADRLMPAFNSPSGIPYSTINLKTYTPHQSHPFAWLSLDPYRGRAWSTGPSYLSEFGTLQMEFRYLTRMSKNQKYADAVRFATAYG